MAQQIKTNTATLQAILDTINALPDGSDGASLDTCTVTFISNDPFQSTESCQVIYVGADGQTKSSNGYQTLRL